MTSRDEMNATGLEACPFCGCTDVANNDDGDHEWFECGWCHATSGFDPAPEFEGRPASFHWNRRTSQPKGNAEGVKDGLDAAGVAERDIYEVANQLQGYVGPDTPKPLADFLMREGEEAAKLAEEIERLRSALVDAPAGETEVCASEGCGKPAAIHFIRGDVGSYFCADCYRRVHAGEQERLASLASPTPSVAALQAEIEGLNLRAETFERQYRQVLQDHSSAMATLDAAGKLDRLRVAEIHRLNKLVVELALAATELLDTSPDERSAPAVWFPRVDRLKAAISACQTPQIVE